MFERNLKSEEFAQRLISQNIFHIIFCNEESGEVTCSPIEAKEYIPMITNAIEWKDHEAVMLEVDEQSKCIYIVCIHKTKRGRSEGGVRIVNPSQSGLGKDFYLLDGLNDCLALAYGMTIKNAYADIWEGGAKSVIIPFNYKTYEQLKAEQAKTIDESVGIFRELLWRNYCRFILKMQGVYLIGEDMNLNSWDMRTILKYIVHSSCHDKSVGGAGNPSPKTAKGVFRAIEAACDTKNYSLHQKTVLIKGMGQVGSALSEYLLETGCTVFGYDLKSENELQEKIKSNSRFQYKQVNTLEDELTHIKEVNPDIFSPNAKNGTLTNDVVNLISSQTKIKIIAGGENAQIARNDTYDVVNKLHNKNIIYLPEAAINYMGVFSAYQEHNGILYADFERVADEIYDKTKKLLNSPQAPYYAFEEEALIKSEELNPLFKDHRGKNIINEIYNNWITAG
jgi:leucine dehydrogenase